MPTSQELYRQLEARYPLVAADLLRPILEFLTTARELLGGDAEKILIMLVVSIRTKQHPDFPKLTATELEDDRIAMLPSLGVNVRSIAESTGIPKESVRRKVAELVEAGFLVRDENDFRYTPEGYKAVAPAREAIERLAVRNFQIVSRVLCTDPPAP